MKRVVAGRWWIVGLTVLCGVLAVSLLMRRSDEIHQQSQQREVARQVQQALSASVGDVLSRERALARVVGTLRSPTAEPWPVLADVVTGESVASGAGLIEPVTEQARAGFERRTGIKLVDSPKPGVLKPAAVRPLHLVLMRSFSPATASAPDGLDLAISPVRTAVMLRAARTGLQLATPPVRLLTLVGHPYGVVVYAPVRRSGGHLLGWVTASYRAQQLAGMVTARLPGMHLTIRDGSALLFSNVRHPAGSPSVIRVAGRRWQIWARPATGVTFTSSWLVLGLGLALAVLIALALRQAGTRESYAMQVAAEREAEELALTKIATLVAERGAPDAVFDLVAEELGTLIESVTAAVSRFEVPLNRGVVVGGWSATGMDLTGMTFALDGDTASAQVFRNGQPARTDSYRSSVDPISSVMSEADAHAGIAAPIRVAGQVWGAIGAAYEGGRIPHTAEERLVRFASLVGLAFANADAWDRLARQAATDGLTGLANRRAFDARLGSELARVGRYERELAVALLDVDHFKQINDRHGHTAGDVVLVRLARMLDENARDGDLVARVGGEEFAWIMPETGAEGALAAVERLRRAFAAEGFTVGKVTLSAGLTAVEEAAPAEAVLTAADDALYSAKAGGRNRTCLHGTMPDPALAG